MIGAIDFDREASPIEPQMGPMPEVHLDWEAYFYEFVRKHGDPVNAEGRLLFRDGWTYSATDYAGPEWRPPKEKKERERLKKVYWTIRRSLILQEKYIMEDMLKGLEETQHSKDVPLQRQAFVMRVINDDKEEQQVVPRGPIAYEVLQGRLEWLERDLLVCNKELGT